MIIGDDQGWGDYGFMGHPHIRTPHLDGLAKQSLLFRHGYVPSSLCRPSLASMITGLYPHEHKITSNDPPLPKGKTGAAANKDPQFLAQRQEMIAYIDKAPTLPRLLEKRGYLSFQAGKWWEGNHCRCGFTDGMTHGDPARGGRHGDEGLKIGRQGLTEVLTFLDSARAKGKPFYLWYAPMMPHSPHNPPEALLKRYTGKVASLHVARYWAMCEWFDETCGALLKYLDDHKLAENTIVVFICDNGWIQDPDSANYGPRSKRSPYDGGIRTPIMIRWPGHAAARVHDEPVSSIDLAPTILHAAGIPPAEVMTGVNLLAAEGVARRDAVFGAIFEHNAVDIHKPAANLQYRWVVSSGWKLIDPAPRLGANAKPELYEISKDPYEKSDLSGRNPERLKTLRNRLNQWWLGAD
jgi:uncharacterized sulfatase